MRKRSRIQAPLFTGQAMTAAELRELQAATALESDVQRQVRTELARAGWWAVRINGGGFYNRSGQWVATYDVPGIGGKGHPDLVAYRGSGRLTCEALFVEVKRKGGKLRASQQRFIAHATALGIQVHVCESWEDVTTLIKAL